MKVLSRLLFVTLSLEGVSGTLLRGRNEQVMPPLEESPYAICTNAMPKATLLTERKLSASDFSALDCNSGVEEPHQACLPWTSAFSNATSYSEEVLIPCGQCYEMDLLDDTLDLTGGLLDIQGKLVFPDGYKLTLKATFIRIQGELHMTSTKIPNGQEDVRFVLTGTDEDLTKFTPADNNVVVCNGQCSVGKKPIVVARGKLVINGLPSASDFLHGSLFTTLLQHRPPNPYHLMNTTPTKPLPSLTAVTARAKTDNADFAVEVALLSRNIVFEGANDDPLHGAHLVVFHTPLIQQKIERVEFRNFGQQGTLGRYPIHFHMCGDVTGSVVSKNLIRETNQRCIVVHQSHNLQVDGNVAYDTFGHCFMMEDGNEKGNVFTNNLGALTHDVPENNVIPDSGTNGKETDNDATTFWMTNPSNTWVGNIAAGLQTNGFWFEMHDRVRGPNAEEFDDMRPKQDPLTLFSNNVAHSNGVGMRTYPNGFIPDERAVFLNSRIYRNRGDGLFMHNSRNLAVVGSIFADNHKQIDCDRADEIELRDTNIVGVSSEYRALIASQSVPSICDTYGYVTGSTKDNGAMIENVTISGLVNTGCNKAVAVNFDDEIRRGSFDYFSTFSNVQIMGEGAVLVNACVPEGLDVSDLFITDLDSSFRPSSSNFTGISSIVGNIGLIGSFVDTSKCITSTHYDCNMYCEGTCLRTVTYTVDPANSAILKLKVCETTSNPPVCAEIDRTYYYDQEDSPEETLIRNTRSDRFRYFSVTLPNGQYTAEFIDNRVPTWPSFVDETYEDALCTDNVLLKGTVTLHIPSILNSTQCNNLIKNGDAEALTTDPLYWLHRKGGVVLNTTDSRNGNNSLGDLEHTDASMDAISQFLDSRCLAERSGDLFEIKAWVKLVDLAMGQPYHCDETTEKCPKVGIIAYSAPNVRSWSKEPVATTVSLHDTRDYQLVHGLLAINEQMANANNVLFYIERNKANLGMLVDDVSMTAVSQSDATYCDDLLYNSNFDVGDTRFWTEYDRNCPFQVVSVNRSFALQMYGGSPQTYLKMGCLALNERYVLSAKFKIIESDGTAFVCDNESHDDPSTRCPTLRLKADSEPTQTISYTVGIPSTGWSEIYGIFTAVDIFASAEKIKLTFGDIANDKNFIVDKISIEKLPMDCDELVLNNDLELGYVRFWGEYGRAHGTFENVPGHASPMAIEYLNWVQTYYGPEYKARYFMDFHCLLPNTIWEVTVRVKLT